MNAIYRRGEWPPPAPTKWVTLTTLGIGLLGLWALLRLQPAVVAAPASQGELREFHLTAMPAPWEIAPGLVVDGWTYNGQVPGPELQVREGDLVRIVLTNQLPVPTTIHWHGIDVPNAMDGVPGLTQEPVEPGESFVYEFPATNPGTRIYHSHQDVNAQMELGLYGALIVEHLDDPNGRFDRDYTILLDEKALDFTPDVALGKASLRNTETGNGRGGAFDFDLFLMNGKAGTEIPPIELAQGERVRLRLVNVGHLLHSMHTHGHSFKIIATDGNPVPPAGQWIKDTVTLGPGERYDIEFVGHNPGVWLFHCHMPNHGENGMMTTINYEGVAPPVEGGGGHAGHSGAPLPGSSESVGSAPPAQPSSSAAAFEVAVLDNRFDPRTLTVPLGSTVAWRSRGINFHTSTSFDNRWDSGNLAPGQSFSFTFTQPGTYRYFCRQHGTQGQVATVVVQP